MTVVRDYDLHPPDDLRLFPMPEPGILRLDDRAFVAVVRYRDIVVWHYAFADRWFKINATTDPESRLVETTAPGEVPPFTFNRDIATPMRRHGDAVFAVDLFLDVLVRSAGVTYGVHDQFDHAVRQGWVSQREAQGARDGIAELPGLIQAGRLMAFLGDAYPAGAVAAPEAPTMQAVLLGEIRLLQPGARPWW